MLKNPWRLSVLLLAALIFLYAVSLIWINVPDTLKGGIREIQFASGAIAYILASLLVITASRPVFLNRLLPLDKYYLLHKILGMSCVILVAVHYFSKDLGRAVLPLFIDFSAAPASAPRVSSGGYSLRRFAEDSATYLTYISLILILLTFVKAVPYRIWQRLHRLFPAIYLVIILHAAILTESYQYPSVLSILCLILTLLAVPCAVKSLLSRGGSSMQCRACVTDCTVDERYVCLTLKAAAGFARAGAFALLKLKGDNPHPYTIASARAENGTALITFYVRKGTYFARKLAALKAGDSLTVEGPYGGCAFPLPQASEDKVLWVFQGAGLSQLGAALSQLQSSNAQGKAVILCLVRSSSDRLLNSCEDGLTAAQASGSVRLIVHESRNQGHFTAEQAQKLMASGFQAAACCGSTALKELFRSLFLKAGGDPKRFLSEYTAWRGFRPWH